MPRFNGRGDYCAGIGSGIVSLNGQAIASPAGSADWYADDVVVYQVQRNGAWSLEYYDTRTTQFARAAEHGANAIEAGGGVWAAQVRTDVVDSRGRSWSNRGLRAVGPDGTVALTTTPYHVGTGITLVTLDGQHQNLEARAGTALHIPAPGALVWTDGNRPQVHGLPVPHVVPGPIYMPRAVRVADQWWLVYQDGADRVLVQPFGEPLGYVAHVGTAYGLDARASSEASIRLVWSRTAGEPPADLVLRDVNLTQLRVPLVRVPTPGPTLPNPGTPPPTPKPEEPPVPTPPMLPAYVTDTAREFPLPHDNWTDENRRLWMRKVIEQVVYDHPGEGWGWKSTTPTSPPSKDAIVKREGGLTYYFDLVNGSTRQVNAPGRMSLLTNQHFIEVAGVDHLGTPKPPQKPPAEPPSEPPPQPPTACQCDEKLLVLGEALSELSRRLGALEDAKYRVVGSTSRSWSHAHDVDLTVERVR